MSVQVKVLHPSQLGAGTSSGGMSRQEAVSSLLVGSEGIFMGTSTVPPGLRSSAHVHTNCESALYVVSGRGRFLTGRELGCSLQFSQGDFIYVPPGAPHLVVNDAQEDLVFVIARNTQEEQVEEYHPGDGAMVERHRSPPLAEPLLSNRCKTCGVPIRGPLAVISRLKGIAPYRKNPQLCNRCESRIKGAEDRVVTTLFADIRGSTAMSVDRSRDDFVALLRRFFRDASSAVYAHDGIVDRFLGDGMLVFFNAPVPRDTHAEDALQAALDIQHRLRDAPFGVGIGIETGIARSGNIGLGEVCDFTCVGEPVNIAARLQALANPGEIVLGPAAWRMLAELVASRGIEQEAETVDVKGVGPISIHRLRVF